MRIVLMAVCAIAMAQSRRDDWTLHPLDPRGVLTMTLADAPLSDAERDEIYRVIDDKTVHDTFPDSRRAEERRTVLASRVGFIGLSSEHGLQLLVQSPVMFCGAPGNCSYWVFLREQGKLRLVLSAGGNDFILKNSLSGGFHDVAFGWHMSAFEESYADYRWDGNEYQRVDCYDAKWPRDQPRAAPSITGCQ
jgi:hypothetical protein